MAAYAQKLTLQIEELNTQYKAHQDWITLQENRLQSLIRPGTDELKKRSTLPRQLTEAFNLEELKSLCHSLQINHDEFPQARSRFAEEMIAYLQRRGDLYRLIPLCELQRPNYDWHGLG